jgi:hypothetical protein
LQVTYSQLQLGENYRSYNNRQSHPNLRAAVAESVNGADPAENGDRWATRRRRGRSFSTTKSAPVNIYLNLSKTILYFVKMIKKIENAI